MQAAKSNSALLQVLVGFLVGAVFVSVFTGGGHGGDMVSARLDASSFFTFRASHQKKRLLCPAAPGDSMCGEEEPEDGRDQC